jgi:hypothetical protein
MDEEDYTLHDIDDLLGYQEKPKPSFAIVAATTNRVKLYETAKAAAAGECVKCPGCVKPFTKKTKSQGFCSNKGSGNCKDRYHNIVNEKRRERASYYPR